MRPNLDHILFFYGGGIHFHLTFVWNGSSGCSSITRDNAVPNSHVLAKSALKYSVLWLGPSQALDERCGNSMYIDDWMRMSHPNKHNYEW